MQLANQIALVTGGGRGIGRAIALAFAEEGAEVVVAARTAAEIEAVAEEVRQRGRRALAVPTDVTDEASVNALIDRTVQEFGRLELLVNNAGWGIFKRVVDLTAAEWDSIIAVNLRSVFLGCKAALPHLMAQQRGVILNVSSMAAYGGAPDYGPYSASKAAVNNLTQTLAAEAQPYNVRVNAICPGPVASRLRSSHYPEEDPTRLMPPDTVAAVAVFLASDAARGISGAAINVRNY
jgi:NAD(P)-dependent dehydrogenase (short-subunit alcohol dehydrogenase family)